MEVIDIGADTFNIDSGPSIKIGEDKPVTNVNFGPGIELLMNDKKRSSSEGEKIDLGDLDALESEMNQLSSNIETINIEKSNDTSNKTVDNLNANLFGIGGFTDASEPDNNDSNIGRATGETVGSTKTWDGFTKFNDVPNDIPSHSKLSDREKRRKKRAMLKKLEEWGQKGQIQYNSNFNMDSSFEEIEDEYETVMDDKRKKDAVKLQGWWFMTAINSLEYANAAFDPFGLNLEGWGEQVSEDIDSYEEIFTELHEKYKGGKMAPEISLLLRVGFSAAVLNFSNKALSSATPAFNDVIKQSPELMKMFTDATVSSMSQNSPGFNMANNFVQEQSRPRGPPPPAPVETKNQPPSRQMNMNFTESNRPDIDASRGTMFQERGVEINNHSNLNETKQRPEMKGPSGDIDNILSGLKTRTINIQEKTEPSNKGEDSMISINSLNDVQNNNMPKRSNKRRNKSDKNTISLDI